MCTLEAVSHPVTTADCQYAEISIEISSVNFNPPQLHNYRIVTIHTYPTSNSTWFLCKNVDLPVLKKRLIFEGRFIT